MAHVKWGLLLKKLPLENQKNNIEKKNQLKSFAKYSGLGIQMGIIIYLGSYLGEKLDVHFDNQNQLYTKIATLTAVFLSIYLVISQLIKSQKSD